MERFGFVLPKKVPAETREVLAAVTRNTYSNADKEDCIKLARQVGASATAREWNRKRKQPGQADMTEVQPRKWLKLWQADDKMPKNQTRGAKPALNEDEMKEVAEIATEIREGGKTVSGRCFASIARGVIAREKPGLLHKNGGIFKLDSKWGVRHLHKLGWNQRAKTSTRVTDPQEVCVPFYIQPYHRWWRLLKSSSVKFV